MVIESDVVVQEGTKRQNYYICSRAPVICSERSNSSMIIFVGNIILTDRKYIRPSTIRVNAPLKKLGVIFDFKKLTLW